MENTNQENTSMNAEEFALLAENTGKHLLTLMEDFVTYRIGLPEKKPITIPIGEILFYPNGNTIWINGTEGGNTLRIKTKGKIFTDQCKNSPISHCDILVEQDIYFCVSNDAKEFNVLKDKSQNCQFCTGGENCPHKKMN